MVDQEVAEGKPRAEEHWAEKGGQEAPLEVHKEQPRAGIVEW